MAIDPSLIDENGFVKSTAYTPEQLAAMRQEKAVADLESMGSVGRGVYYGIDSMQGNLFNAAGQLLEPFAPGMANAAYKAGLRNQQEAQRYIAPSDIMTTDQIDGLGTGLSYVSRKVGENLPNMAVTIPAAIAARYGMSRFAGLNAASPLAKNVMATSLGAAPMQLGEMAGSMREDPAIMESTTPMQRLGHAARYAALTAPMEAADEALLLTRATGAGKVVKNVFKDGIKQSTKDAVKHVAKSVPEAMLTEGVPEALQQKTQQTMLSNLNPQRDTSGDEKEIKESFFGGWAAGGPSSVIGRGADVAWAQGRGGVEALKGLLTPKTLPDSLKDSDDKSIIDWDNKDNEERNYYARRLADDAVDNEKAPENVREAAKSFYEKVEAGAGDAWRAMADAVNENEYARRAGDGVRDFMDAAKRTTDRRWKTEDETVEQHGSSLMDEIKQGVGEQWDDLKEAAKGGWDTLAGKLDKANWPGKDSKVVDNFMDAWRRTQARRSFDPNAIDDGNTIDGEYTKNTEKFSAASDKFDQAMYKDFGSYLDKRGATARDTKLKSGLFNTLKQALRDDAWDELPWTQLEDEFGGSERARKAVSSLRDNMVRAGQLEHIEGFETLLKATMEDGAGAEQAQREVVMRYGKSFIGEASPHSRMVDAKEAVRGIRNFLANESQMKPELRDAIWRKLTSEFGTNLDKVLRAHSPKRFQEGEVDHEATEDGDEDAAVGRFKEQSGETYMPGTRFLGRGIESARKHLAADKPIDPKEKDIIKQHGGFWKLGHPNPKTRAEIQAEFKQTAADLRRDGYYVRELSPLEYAKEAGVDPEKIASHLSKGLKEEDKLTVADLKDHPARMLAVEERERGKDPLSLDMDDLKNLAEKTEQSLKAIPDELPIRDPAKAAAVEKALYTKHGGAEQRKQMRELGLEHGVKLERRGGVAYLKNNALHGGNGVFEVFLKRTEAQEAAWQEAHKTRKATDKEIAKDVKGRTKYISAMQLISLMRKRGESEIDDRSAYAVFKLGIAALRDMDTVEKIIVRDVWGREQKEDKFYGVFGPYFRLERGGNEDVTLGWAHKKAQSKAASDADRLKSEAEGVNELGDMDDLRTVDEAIQRLDNIDAAIADAQDKLEKVRAKQEHLGTAIDETTGKRSEAAQAKLDKLDEEEQALLDEINTLNNYLDEAVDKLEELQAIEDTISGEGDREGLAGGNRRRKYEGMEEVGLDGNIKETVRKFNDDGTPLNAYGKPGDDFKTNVSKNYNGVPLRLRPGVSGKHFVGGARKALGVIKKIRALLTGPTLSYHLDRATDYLAHSAAAQKAGDIKARDAATNAAAYIMVETLADEKALIEGEGNLLPEGAEKQKLREKYAELTRLGALAIDRAKEYRDNKEEMDALIAPYTPRREYLNEGQRAALAAQKKAREAKRKEFEKNFGERWDAHSYFLDTLERKTTDELISDGKARAARIERFEDKPNLTANLAELIRLMNYEQDLARAEIKKRRGDKPAQVAEAKAEPAGETATDEVAAEEKKGRRNRVAEKAAEAKAAAAERKASHDAAMAIPPQPPLADTALSSVTQAAKAPQFAREKELAKASGADFVYAPTGVRGSFASRLAEGAKVEGRLIDPKGTEDISGKKVYVSVPGASRGFDGMEKATADVLALLERGARVRTDNEKNASTKHNKAGEGVLREALLKAGMIEANMGLFSEWRAPETLKAEAGRTSTAETVAEVRGPSAKWRERLNHLLNQSVHGVLQDNERVENARLPGFFNALPEHYAHLKALDAQGQLNPRSELPEGATLRDKTTHRKANPERYAAADAFEEMQRLITMANKEPEKLAGVVNKLAMVPGSVTEKDVEAFAKALKQAEAAEAPAVATQPDAAEKLTPRQRAARKAAETRKRNAEAKKAAAAEAAKTEEAPKTEVPRLEAPKAEVPRLEAPKTEEAPKAEEAGASQSANREQSAEDPKLSKLSDAFAKAFDLLGKGAAYLGKGARQLLDATERVFYNIAEAIRNQDWSRKGLTETLGKAVTALRKAVANAPATMKQAFNKLREAARELIQKYRAGKGGAGGEPSGVKYSAAATTVNRGALAWAKEVKQGIARAPGAVLAERPADALRMVGMHRPLVIDLEHARHIFNTHPDITPETIASLPELLKSPRAILKHKDGWRLVLNQRDKDGQPLAVGLTHGKMQDNKNVLKVTEVSTLFGMEESARLIAQAAIKGDLLYMPKKEVARLRELLSGALIAPQPSLDDTTPPTSPATSRSGVHQAVSSPSSDGYKVSVASDEALRKFTFDPKSDWKNSKETFALPADVMQRLKGAKFSEAATAVKNQATNAVIEFRKNATHNRIIFNDKNIQRAVSYKAGDTNAPKVSSSYATGKDVTPEDMKAVAEYVRKVLGPQVAVSLAKELGGNSASWQRNDKGEALIRIALHAANPMSHAHHEAMHEFFQRLLDSGSPAADVLLKAASSAAVRRQIEQFFNEDANYAKIVEALKDPHERVAYMFQLWAAGQLKLGPQTKNVFQKIAATLRKLFGVLSADQRAEALMQHFHDGKMSSPSAVAAVLAKDPKMVQNLIDRAAEWLRPIAQGAKDGLWTAQNMLTESGIKSFEHIGRLFSTETGREGEDISFFDAKTMKTNQMNDRLWDILQDLDEKDKAAALEGLQRGIVSKDPKIASAQQRITKLLEQIHDYMTKDGDKPGPLKVRKIKDYFPRVWDPVAIAENRELFEKMLEEEHLRTTGKPLPPHQADWTSHFLTTNKGSEPVSETELSGGYSPFMAAGNERVLDFIKSPEFARFQQKDLVGILTTYIAEAVQKTEYARRFGQNGKRMRKMVLDGVGEAVGDGWDEAVKKAMDARDKVQEELRVRSATPAEKVEAMTKAGYRYGDILPQHVRDQLTGDALKRYDAFEPKLRQYMRSIMAMEGTLGADINPTMRKWNSGLIVYENIRLLSMSLFSQVIDPLGVLVRGSDISHAWDTFKRGVAGTIAGWRGKPQMDAAMKLAMKLGVVDAGGYLNSQGNAYSSVYMGKTAQKINDKLFRWNGVEGFSQGTRVGAMLAAIDFIKQHSSSPEEHSKRWLAELNLKPEDVVLKGGELDYTNPKIQQAIFRWVEGAILRPNASMRPSWASDPHWALVFHLKQFTYAMQKVLLERVANEIKHGNYDPAITMLFTYVPAMIAADFLRGIAANGGEEPPWKRKWNFGDYLSEGVQRAGLLGVPQLALDAAQWGPAELAGPVVGQVSRTGKQFYKDAAKDRKLDAIAAQTKAPKDVAKAEKFDGVTHAAKRTLRDALPLGAFTKKYVYDEVVREVEHAAKAAH